MKEFRWCVFEETPWDEEICRNNEFVIINNILINGKMCKGDIAIPDNVKIVFFQDFAGNEELISVKIPENVKLWYINAF